MTEPPPGTCGFTWSPEWLDRAKHQHCCTRETWNDADRCWWHFEGEKSLTDLRVAAGEHECSLEDVPGARRETAANRELNAGIVGDDRDVPAESPYPAELLCGAHLPELELKTEFDFGHCWLNGANLEGSNLRGANLSKADMERVELGDAVLRDATLRRADVRGDVSGADLRGADLSEANVCVAEKVFASLPRPDLSGAHLADADLSGTRLDGADLTDARLTGADLSGASLEMATMERVNLFGANLADARLYGTVLGEAQINRDTKFFPDDHDRCVYHPDPTGSRFSRLLGGSDGDAPASADGGERPPPDADRYSKAAWTYRAIERLARQNSFPSLQSRMFLERQRMQTRMYRRTDGWLSGTHLFARVSQLFINHGEGYLRVLVWGAVLVVTFALLFPFGGWIRPVESGGRLATPITWGRIADDPILLWESVYYSTLTFTNLGFGDFRPVGTVGQALTVAETASGAVLLALLVFVLGRRASR